MVTEIVVIYVCINLFILMGMPSIAYELTHGFDSRGNFSDIDRFNMFMVLVAGLPLLLFAYLPYQILGSIGDR